MSSITLEAFLNPDKTPEQIAAGARTQVDYVRWVRLEQSEKTKIITAYHDYLVPAVAGQTSLYAAAINLTFPRRTPADILEQHIKLREERYERLVERGVRLNLFLGDPVRTNMESIDEAARDSQLRRLGEIAQDPLVDLKYVEFDPTRNSIQRPQGRSPVLLIGNNPKLPYQEPTAAYLENGWGQTATLITDPGELQVIAGDFSDLVEGHLYNP